MRYEVFIRSKGNSWRKVSRGFENLKSAQFYIEACQIASSPYFPPLEFFIESLEPATEPELKGDLHE